MLIANPLFDTSFKQLARDLDVAKAIIEILLDVEVIDIQLGPTEHNKPMDGDDKRPRYCRTDYSVTIKTKDGASQKILIEMQKAHGAEALLRFREYLAIAGYNPKPPEKDPFPIVTIYFLGFPLKNVDTPCLKVVRQYIDMLSNEVLETKDRFVELLSHDAYIIQASRIKLDAAPQTELERVLSMFRQGDFVDGKEEEINYKYPVDRPYLKQMVDILHYIATDPEERKKMDEEAYWRRYEEYTYGEALQRTIELEGRLSETEGELSHAKGELSHAKGELSHAKGELSQTKSELSHAKDIISEAKKREEASIKNLLSKGFSAEEAASLLGVTAEAVRSVEQAP